LGKQIIPLSIAHLSTGPKEALYSTSPGINTRMDPKITGGAVVDVSPQEESDAVENYEVGHHVPGVAPIAWPKFALPAVITFLPT
jgi:hypothetical protein